MIVADHEYHVVELEYLDKDAMAWCLNMFGNPNERRWFNRNNKVYFYNAHDHMMFILRWG